MLRFSWHSPITYVWRLNIWKSEDMLTRWGNPRPSEHIASLPSSWRLYRRYRQLTQQLEVIQRILTAYPAAGGYTEDTDSLPSSWRLYRGQAEDMLRPSSPRWIYWQEDRESAARIYTHLTLFTHICTS